MKSPRDAANNSSPDPARPPFVALFIATGALSGLSPWAPGTVGTLAGLLLVVFTGATAPLVLGLLIVAGFVLGGFAANSVARHVGNRLTPTAALAKELFQPGKHETPDPSMVVIDEFVGIWITLLFLPPTPASWICAFIVFRAFDILKPAPARQLEKIPNGWGIMLDDVVAGVYANIATQLIIRLVMPLVLPL